MPKETIERNPGLDFTQLWLRHIVYWPFFLLLFLLAFGGAWLYLHIKNPVYVADAKILIKDEKKGSENTEAMNFLNLMGTKKLLENEKDVISSKTIILQTVKNLGLYASVFKKQGLRTIPAYVTSPITIELQKPDLLSEESDDIYFTYNPKDSTVIIDELAYPIKKWVTVNGQVIRFLPHKSDASDKNKNYFFILSNPSVVADDIRERLEVTPSSKLSSILDLQLKDEVPERAKDILNDLMVVYGQANMHDKNVLAQNTMAFVEERLTQVAKELDSVEARMQKYKSSKGAFNIDTQSDLFLKNVSENDQKLSEINMRLSVLNQVENYVLSKDRESGVVPSTLGVTDETLTRLLGLLYQAELEYTKLKTTEAENSPALISINNQIQKIRPNIIENIQSQRRSLEASKQNLLATNANYSSVLQSMPQKEKELLDISREHNIINATYSFLLQKREESALSYASTLPNSSIVDKADSNYYPVSPKRKMVYGLAIIVPLVIGIGLITVKETFNTKVLFRQEIENISSYPVIGEISADKSKNPLVIDRRNRTFIAEQFRQLRVALSLNNKGLGYKRVLITSTIAGEGKSFIALNLATSFALSGKKTVLLELDLSHPSISDKVNMIKSPGISEYLQGLYEPEEIIRRSDFNENLFIIPAGSAPDAHPSELLENGRITELLNYSNEIFDWVIIDTAPVNAITDAYLLANKCDVTLYVIRHGYTPKVFIQRLDQNNKNNRLNNIAIVFNGIRPRGFGKHHYGYGYGYGYVYNENNKIRMET
jgi:capsular exopolysaccharide synthesis family protein